MMLNWYFQKCSPYRENYDFCSLSVFYEEYTSFLRNSATICLLSVYTLIDE